MRLVVLFTLVLSAMFLLTSCVEENNLLTEGSGKIRGRIVLEEESFDGTAFVTTIP